MDPVAEDASLSLAAAGDGVATPIRRTLGDVFDNEALWNADDTDEYILTLAGELETSLGTPTTEMNDAGDNSLLHMAAIWNRPKVMEALIRRGAELNDKNASGSTPLDLATHYGNVDLALQLRHYGAKHTCESERDLAVAQRDLADTQLRDLEADLQDALQRLKSTKQEREEIRIERDRRLEENVSLVSLRDALASEKAVLDQAVAVLTQQNHQSLLQLAQLRETLACESDARLNAAQSWHNAQQVIAELQEREVAFLQREEAAQRMCDEAKRDREVAREVARLAELDQGLAKQAQLEAERERDRAVQKQLEAENAIATEKELWAKRIAKTERDRKNIQIEIDRQTAALRKECDRLEKQLRTASSLTWSLRDELAGKTSLVDRLENRVQFLEDHAHQLEGTNHALESQVASLEEAQRSQHKAWRDQLEQTLRDEALHDMKRIVAEVVATAEKLAAQDTVLRALGLRTKREFLLQPELTSSLFSDHGSLRSSMSSPVLRKTTATVLPFLPDRSGSSNNSVTTPTLLPVTPALSPRETGASSAPDTEGAEEGFQLDFVSDQAAVTAVISTGRTALHLDVDHLQFSTVADIVASLAEVIRKQLDETATFVTRNWRHFRKQVQALEKMVERKDELISRFNQHRRDKPKKPSARLRECIYKPLI